VAEALMRLCVAGVVLRSDSELRGGGPRPTAYTDNQKKHTQARHCAPHQHLAMKDKPLLSYLPRQQNLAQQQTHPDGL
jgi:hypothetical protein